MSEIKVDPVFAPPSFPNGGRLNLTLAQLKENYRLRNKETRAYQQSDLDNRGSCVKSLHISFFFDGTNNNKNNDKSSTPRHPTNIAKLYDTTHRDEREYFAYYMPGVGTPFPEIREFQYSSEGLKYATGGENRINWAIMMLTDALIRALKLEVYTDSDYAQFVNEMATNWVMNNGQDKRQRILEKIATEKQLLAKIETTKPRILGLKLFVYGFSRGAAEARAFIHFLSQLIDTRLDKQRPTLFGLPISIEFLGILDTVPSVGIVHLVPAFSGHMDWANNTQQLPDEKQFPNFVKCCRHFVAAHEQRLCFPMDSVRRPTDKESKTSHYPNNTFEVVYPGMHSDIGGGYPINDQGKARNSEGEILSQIVLHDMYLAAFMAGAPLKVSPALENTVYGTKLVEKMEPDNFLEFKISPQLIERFSSWRKMLGVSLSTPATNDDYIPEKLTDKLEDVMKDQMGWMTAWRINRYAQGRYRQQPFYPSAEEWDEETIKKNQLARKKDDIDLKKAIKQWDYLKSQNLPINSPPPEGKPLFESKRDKTQLAEAAAEFKADYHKQIRTFNDKALYMMLDIIPKYTMYLLNSDDEVVEYKEMKAAGEKYRKHLFQENGEPSTDKDHRNIVLLFDDHVHDSRAWFMHFETGAREPWAGYFRYRMIYFGEQTNKALSPIAVAGQLVGIATLVGGVIYTVRQRDALGVVGGIAGTVGILSLEYQVVDIATGLAIPFMPEAEKLLQPKTDNSDVVAATRQLAQQNQEMETQRKLMEFLMNSGSRVLTIS
ncbi:T6SS phospholipase effector Tle1-like catalytic domain-containing protein [Proteus mirabilis]|uniref:T6SS phospholipase effector Tle1-like catalytic domain-containing protein n=1 Tax=Proteus mirabilis TaxID=584 RepID=UPI000F5BDDB1|nr:DUF2235 domain-containing protein [Proteus mirabilis]MBS3828298.1 DUF2235 domain-containing protein [Proteus mirabilis]MBS3838969.1 DUF2235 domain-containing protein [Proteus mirabilis]MDC9788518.1 DUF2235 domain-containing protein [Proteus mirabilis]RQW14891.1 DUF2235 domain-containing protein [Proteus mirabilis]